MCVVGSALGFFCVRLSRVWWNGLGIGEISISPILACLCLELTWKSSGVCKGKVAFKACAKQIASHFFQAAILEIGLSVFFAVSSSHFTQ